MKRFLAVLLVVALPAPAFAEVKHIPLWSMCQDTGEKRACYTFEQTVKLVEFDLQLDKMLVEEIIQLKQIEDLKLSTKSLDAALKLEKNSTTELKKNNDKLVADLLKETERANKAEARQGPSVGWLVAGGVGLVAVGVVSGILLGVYVAK